MYTIASVLSFFVLGGVYSASVQPTTLTASVRFLNTTVAGQSLSSTALSSTPSPTATGGNCIVLALPSTTKTYLFGGNGISCKTNTEEFTASAGSIPPVTQTTVEGLISFTTTTTSETMLSDIATTTPTSELSFTILPIDLPKTSENIVLPSLPATFFPPPDVEETDAANQSPPIQTSNVVETQPSTSSKQQVYSTQIPVGNPTTTFSVPQPIITLGTNTLSPATSSSVYIINSQTLVPGGPPLTVSDSILSLAPDGGEVVVLPTAQLENGEPVSPPSTIDLFSNLSLPPPPTTTPTPVIATIGNFPITITPSASSVVFTPSAGPPITLFPGSPAITLSGSSIISLSPANNPTAAPVLIISTPGASTAQSITFPVFSPPSPSPPSAPLSSFMPIAISSSALIIDGITLTPNGPAATASNGVPISLGANTDSNASVDGNSILVLGSSTITIAQTETGLGGYIWSGIGGVLSSTVSNMPSSGSGLTANSTTETQALPQPTGLTTLASTTTDSSTSSTSSTTGASPIQNSEAAAARRFLRAETLSTTALVLSCLTLYLGNLLP